MNLLSLMYRHYDCMLSQNIDDKSYWLVLKNPADLDGYPRATYGQLKILERNCQRIYESIKEALNGAEEERSTNETTQYPVK